MKTLAGRGVLVERWNLAQQPQAFTENPQVKDLLAKLGVKGLPFIFENDELQWTGRYPTAEELLTRFGIKKEEPAFPVLERDEESRSGDACCAEGGCC